MVKVRTTRVSLIVNIEFAPPLFDWNGVPGRFFAFVHGALAPEIFVSPRDFSVAAANSMDEVAARYNIFGGASTIALSAEKLSMEFLNLSVEEYQLIGKIVQAVETGFPRSFPECQYTAIHSMSHYHAEVLGENTASGYLSRYAIPSVDKVLGAMGAVTTAAARFSAVGNDASWSARASVERSEVLENGLFVNMEARLLRVEASDPFEAKWNRLARIDEACESALDLEWEHGE